MSDLKEHIHENGIDYTLCGDYYIPDWQIPAVDRTLGHYDRMRKAYLKNHRPALYVLASAIGSYTNQNKLVRTFKSVKNKNISDKTIKNYTDYLIDSYLISKADRYDIKGKKHIGKLSKYYFEDVGLRNARLGFRQIEETHLMENIIYNELRVRGYHVDVGVVEYYETKADGKRGKKQLEVDFVATKGSEKYYIQSAFALPTADKVNQEQRGLLSISDFFRKIVVVGDNIKVRRDENGIITIGLRNFLLDENSLKL